MKDINWGLVERIMYRSVRGLGIALEEMEYIQEAHKLEPEKYGELHKRVKEKAIEERKLGPW